RLEHEPATPLVVLSVLLADFLEGDLAVQLGVLGDEDLAQSPTGVWPQHPVTEPWLGRRRRVRADQLFGTGWDAGGVGQVVRRFLQKAARLVVGPEQLVQTLAQEGVGAADRVQIPGALAGVQVHSGEEMFAFAHGGRLSKGPWQLLDCPRYRVATPPR